MQAVVIGGTGLVGSVLVRKLLEDAETTRVISVSRSRLGLDHPRFVEVVIENLDALKARSSELTGDSYFCCLGTTLKAAGSREEFRRIDFSAIVSFGEVAKAGKANSFVLVSSFGAAAESPFFYSRVKGETEQALKALDLRSLSIFRPALLLGHRKEPRPLEGIASALLRPVTAVLPLSLGRRITTPAGTLAGAMISKAKQALPGVEILQPADIA